MATVRITIPDALAEEAAAAGLLEPGSIEAILRERLAAAGSPPMTAEEIDASLQRGRRLPICQKGIKRVRSAQCPGLLGHVANLCERDSRVATAHESS